ncbi:MAG: hypothetical protein ACREVH_07615 [Gammaproteobacteria bacterium]
MTRIWMLCLLTALLHSAAYAAKPNAENRAKGKPAVEVPTPDKTDIVRNARDDEEKDPPKHHLDDEDKDPPERKK